jgi:hypothetical protein
VQTLQRPSASSLNSLVESVSRRFSDNLFHNNSSSSSNSPPSKEQIADISSVDEGIHSGPSSTASSTTGQSHPPHPNRHKTWPCSAGGSREGAKGTKGIDIQNLAFPGKIDDREFIDYVNLIQNPANIPFGTFPAMSPSTFVMIILWGTRIVSIWCHFIM